jgi:phage major head subunit gpT-like protein
MIINSATLQSATRAVRGLFLTQLAATASLLPLLTMPATTTTGEAVFGWLGNLPSMKPFKDELDKQALAVSDWTVKTAEYAMGYSIPALAIKRDQFGIYNPVFSAAGQRAGEHRDFMLAAKLKAGFTTSDYTGKNFFDTGKLFVKGAKTTFDNKSTKQLTLAYYRAARKALRNIKDPAGYPVIGSPQFTLIVGPELEGAAKDILMAERLANGASNVEYNSAKLEVWNFIDDAKWYLAVTNSPLKPFIMLDEIKLDLYAKQDHNSEAVFNRHEYEYQAYAVNKVDFGLPQLILGSTGADA